MIGGGGGRRRTCSRCLALDVRHRWWCQPSQGSDFTRSSIKSESTAEPIAFFQDQCDVGAGGRRGQQRGENHGHAGSSQGTH